MEGRWKHFCTPLAKTWTIVAAGILCTLTGCGLFRDHRTGPGATGEPPLSTKKDGPVGAPLLVQFAEVKLQAAADAQKSQAEREALCNDARVSYQKALQTDPKCLDAMLGMGRMFALLKDKEKCIDWYQRAAKANPLNAKVPYEEGRVLGANFKDKDAAIQCLHAATQLDPDNRNYRKELGMTLAWAGRYEEAFAWLKRVMPEAEARYNIAGMMQHNGHDDLAKLQLARAIQADPNHEKSKEFLAWYVSPHEPRNNSVQTVGHVEYSSPPLVTPLQIQPADYSPNRTSIPPASIQTPDAMPLNSRNQSAPNLNATSGWNR
jgi:tetratricopeptide (TPR) repeat protein